MMTVGMVVLGVVLVLVVTGVYLMRGRTRRPGQDDEQAVDEEGIATKRIQ